jgi:DNA end-binding protein Ku
LVKAKIEGRKIRKKPQPKETKVASLLDALRLSAGATAAGSKTKAKAGNARKKAASPAPSSRKKAS